MRSFCATLYNENILSKISEVIVSVYLSQTVIVRQT